MAEDIEDMDDIEDIDDVEDVEERESGQELILNQNLCLVHYDCAVNCGVSSAAKQLQRALNDLGKQVTIDGVIGPLSLKAVSELPNDKLTAACLSVRESFYTALAAENPSQGVFLKGWLNRTARVRQEAANYAG
jgi:lysozyme family protein